jgi:hypothetical protein
MRAGLTKADEIGGVQESRWNPHMAEKDVEVGDFYFKRKNYRAAPRPLPRGFLLQA